MFGLIRFIVDSMTMIMYDYHSELGTMIQTAVINIPKHRPCLDPQFMIQNDPHDQTRFPGGIYEGADSWTQRPCGGKN